jgi:hypothetical protein
MASWQYKLCKVCGRSHDRDAWEALPFEGMSIHNVEISSAKKAEYMRLEMRTCGCGNSLTLELFLLREGTSA